MPHFRIPRLAPDGWFNAGRREMYPEAQFNPGACNSVRRKRSECFYPAVGCVQGAHDLAIEPPLFRSDRPRRGSAV